MKKKQLIGILNCTPDSYFEKGRILDPEMAVSYALELFNEGADWVDIGGESTRPGALLVSENEEIKRVAPVIKGVLSAKNCPLSIDTYKPSVAQKALELGVTMLNDVTGFSNPEMRSLGAKSGAKLCLMHAQSPPHTRANYVYKNGIIEEILNFFKVRIDLLLKEGADTSQIILDPGIGGGFFGKTVEQTFEILSNIAVFCSLGFPVLISLSRKSFLQKFFRKPASELLSTTVALNTMSMLSGAAYIRVHDVSHHRDVLTVLERMDSIRLPQILPL